MTKLYEESIHENNDTIANGNGARKILVQRYFH